MKLKKDIKLQVLVDLQNSCKVWVYACFFVGCPKGMFEERIPYTWVKWFCGVNETNETFERENFFRLDEDQRRLYSIMNVRNNDLWS